MLKGECDELVEGEPIHLKEGNVLMMDIGCHHSIVKLNKDDLMINLIFNNRNISFQFLDEIHKKDSFIYQYLFNISMKNHNVQKFIFFLKMMTSMARWMILLMNIFLATVIAVSLSTISLTFY